MSRITRLSALACVAALTSLGLGACGGKTPPAKDADDTASSASKGDDSTASSASPPSSDAPAPAASAAPAATPAPAADSGDIKAPAGDDPWMAAHQMAAKDVSKTMRGAQGKVQACFKAGLKRDPSTSGEVKLRFVVTNDGAVRAWKDDRSTMTDGDVTQCVGQILNGQKFPKQKSPGDAWGSYSIHYGTN